MARALRRCVSHHEKTGHTDEILRQSHPDGGDLHRHLLGRHGAAAGTCASYDFWAAVRRALIIRDRRKRNRCL